MENLYTNRKIYRNSAGKKDLFPFIISIHETDLHIQTSKKGLESAAEKKVLSTRKIIKDHIKKNPGFQNSLIPIPVEQGDHPVIVKMKNASLLTGVGPMAAVAGALSQEVGDYLLKYSEEVIVENGGDIFIKTEGGFVSGIYAGKDSPFSNRVGIKIESTLQLGICTSSGTIGHSLSYGKADAVTIISQSAYIADSFATSLCNMVKTEKDMDKTINYAKKFTEIKGMVVIINDKIGAFGDLELTPL